MTVVAGHISMEFKDSAKQVRSDFSKVFKKARDDGWWFVTGTEMGDNDYAQIGKEEAAERNFRFAFTGAGDSWVAVDEDRIDGDWSTSWVKCVDASQGQGKHTHKGVFGVHFRNDLLGKMVHIATAHYLTKGRPVSNPEYNVNLKWNQKIADGIGDFANKYEGLLFYGGDQNIPDKEYDTFLGRAPFKSLGDDLKKWPGTGHGAIDVLARCTKNGGVKAKKWNVLDDSEFPLNTDHWLCVGAWTVAV